MAHHPIVIETRLRKAAINLRGVQDSDLTTRDVLVSFWRAEVDRLLDAKNSAQTEGGRSPSH